MPKVCVLWSSTLGAMLWFAMRVCVSEGSLLGGGVGSQSPDYPRLSNKESDQYTVAILAALARLYQESFGM